MHEAVIWWEKASIKNNGQAEFNLAGAYMRGDGVFRFWNGRYLFEKIMLTWICRSV
jgi:TPR repeat protein